GFLRRDIKNGIDNLFEQLPKSKVDQYKELYNTALNDYAVMKQTLKDVKKLGLRDAHNSTEKALDSLIKFTKGQGDKLDNLSAISKGLSKQNREVLELNMLDRLFKKSLVDTQDISVLDSFKFMNYLDELKQSTFKTQGAKDFIEIAKGFHRLFNQDAAIAKALKPTTGGTIGSSIATSVGGAAQFQVTKATFGFIVRTLPYIPFAKALNDKVSGAALRYHIKAALNKSHSIEAFKQNLNKIANRAEFSNATKALIREIEQNLPKSVESGGNVSSGGTQANTANEIKALDSQSEAPVKVIDEAQAVKAQEALLAREIESQTLPTKTKLERDLAPQEIHEVISKWDLSATSNKSGKQRLVVARVEAKEAEELTQAFKFKGQKNLIREIDSHQVIHALKQHGDMATEAQRGQIAINLEDISHYIDTIKEADFKHIQDNGRVLYAKQVNGHVVVIEEALSGQDKLRFFDMWKQKGKLNKEVLLSHSQRPNTTPSLNLEGHMPSNITTPPTPSSKGYDLDRTLSGSYDKPHPTTSPLKSQEPKLLPYKPTSKIYKEAKAKGLSYAEFKALREQSERLFLENKTVAGGQLNTFFSHCLHCPCP
ncbi:hypothetical protein, partial [Helicobacter suis]|uniref:PBECR3 domain-containing polyvalent protein n=1 Tax=Helicobacter suis TaxID=104628 RepID=UPI0013D0AA6C